MAGDGDGDVPLWRGERAKLCERDVGAGRERVPAGLRCRTKRGKRRTIVPLVVRRVRVDQAEDGADRLADGAPFRGEVVLDPPANPDARRLLIEDEGQSAGIAHALPGWQFQ